MSDENTMNAVRYVQCLACPHTMTKFENDHLRAAVYCPGCGRPDTFGLGVFVDDYEGETWDEILKRGAEKRARGWLTTERKSVVT